MDSKKDDLNDISNLDASSLTSLTIKNRILRKSKTVLANGILSSLAVNTIYYDNISWCIGKAGNWDQHHNDLFRRENLNHPLEAIAHDVLQTQVAEECWHGGSWEIACAWFLMFLSSILGIAYFVHAIKFTRKHKNYIANQEIEVRFAITNNIFLFDAFFELPIAMKHVPRPLFLIHIFSFVVTISLGLYAVYNGESPSLPAAIVNAVYCYYIFIGEANEFWVYVKTSVPTGSSTSSNDDESNKSREVEEGWRDKFRSTRQRFLFSR